MSAFVFERHLLALRQLLERCADPRHLDSIRVLFHGLVGVYAQPQRDALAKMLLGESSSQYGWRLIPQRPEQLAQFELPDPETCVEISIRCGHEAYAEQRFIARLIRPSALIADWHWTLPELDFPFQAATHFRYLLPGPTYQTPVWSEHYLG